MWYIIEFLIIYLLTGLFIGWRALGGMEALASKPFKSIGYLFTWPVYLW